MQQEATLNYNTDAARLTIDEGTTAGVAAVEETAPDGTDYLVVTLPFVPTSVVSGGSFGASPQVFWPGDRTLYTDPRTGEESTVDAVFFGPDGLFPDAQAAVRAPYTGARTSIRFYR